MIKMSLYQRLEKEFNEGVKMGALEHKYHSLHERLEGHGRLARSSSRTAQGACSLFGSLDMQLIDECRGQMDSLRRERMTESPSKLENFAYAIGHKVEGLRQRYRSFIREHNRQKYLKRRDQAYAEGWHDKFIADERKKAERREAKRKKKGVLDSA